MNEPRYETVIIPPVRAAGLRREAADSGEDCLPDNMVAESIVRIWFLRRGLPCWRTSQPPECRERYGLLFPSGRRALVTVGIGNPYSFDRMARAKCDYLIRFEMDDERSGRPDGFFYLDDIRNPRSLLWIPDLQGMVMRSMEDFPELTDKPENFRMQYLIGSLRLLIRGDPQVPPPLTPS